MGEAARTTACMTCGAGAQSLTQVLDLGSQPLAERDDGARYPLAVLQCTRCGLAQLSCAVSRAEVFPPDHPYATGNTLALRDHFRHLACEVARITRDGHLVTDIGANDGTFLAALRDAAPRIRLLAVEPTGQAGRCQDRGIPVVQDFFTRDTAAAIRAEHGPAAVITASNVLAHVADQHDFMDGVNELLGPGGVFITENHDWSSVVHGLQVDTVYHEHLRYYTPATLGHLLAMHGFLVDQAVPVPLHGGSFRIWAIRQEGALQQRADRVRDKLLALVSTAAEHGKIYGVGAATRATPLIHYAGLDRWLDRVVEVPGSAKIGTRIPGTAIPVTDEADLIRDQPPYALLLAWHLAGDRGGLMAKLTEAGYRGSYIIPLPVPRIIRSKKRES